MTDLFAALSGAFLPGTAALCPAQALHPAPNGISSESTATTTATPRYAKANAVTRDDYKVESKRIAAEYKESKAKCKSMTGNAKDVCMREAKGQEKVAKAKAMRKNVAMRGTHRATTANGTAPR